MPMCPQPSASSKRLSSRVHCVLGVAPGGRRLEQPQLRRADHKVQQPPGIEINGCWRSASIGTVACLVLGIAVACFVTPRAEAQVFNAREDFLAHSGIVESSGFETAFVAANLVQFTGFSMSSNQVISSTGRLDLVSQGAFSAMVEHSNFTEVVFNFATPIRAFGLDLKDVGDATTGLTLDAFVSSTGLSTTLVTTPPLRPEGETRFFGYLSPQPFQSVAFHISGIPPTTDATGFDALLFGSGCRADLTGDGGVDINDLLFFLSAFEAGTANADLDDGSGTGTPNGGVDINDLLFFLARFEAGC